MKYNVDEITYDDERTIFKSVKNDSCIKNIRLYYQSLNKTF